MKKSPSEIRDFRQRILTRFDIAIHHPPCGYILLAQIPVSSIIKENIK
jgi:hypothetical protein